MCIRCFRVPAALSATSEKELLVATVSCLSTFKNNMMATMRLWAYENEQEVKNSWKDIGAEEEWAGKNNERKNLGKNKKGSGM